MDGWVCSGIGDPPPAVLAAFLHLCVHMKFPASGGSNCSFGTFEVFLLFVEAGMAYFAKIEGRKT